MICDDGLLAGGGHIAMVGPAVSRTVGPQSRVDIRGAPYRNIDPDIINKLLGFLSL